MQTLLLFLAFTDRRPIGSKAYHLDLVPEIVYTSTDFPFQCNANKLQLQQLLIFQIRALLRRFKDLSAQIQRTPSKNEQIQRSSTRSLYSGRRGCCFGNCSIARWFQQAPANWNHNGKCQLSPAPSISWNSCPQFNLCLLFSKPVLSTIQTHGRSGRQFRFQSTCEFVCSTLRIPRSWLMERNQSYRKWDLISIGKAPLIIKVVLTALFHIL